MLDQFLWGHSSRYCEISCSYGYGLSLSTTGLCFRVHVNYWSHLHVHSCHIIRIYIADTTIQDIHLLNPGMVLCNVTHRLQSSVLQMDFSDCNITSAVDVATKSNTTSSDVNVDAEGAMKFTVAVIMVYGMAVMGVLALEFFRKKQRTQSVDDEAVEFVKGYDSVRRSIDRKARVGAVSCLLQSIHNGPASKPGPNTKGTVNMFGNFEFLNFPMTSGNDKTKVDENNNSIKEVTGENCHVDTANTTALGTVKVFGRSECSGVRNDIVANSNEEGDVKENAEALIDVVSVNSKAEYPPRVDLLSEGSHLVTVV